MLSARSATSLLTRSRSISNAAGLSESVPLSTAALRECTHTVRHNQGGYDYVIVGAGSAGAVVAHRLVKDAGAKALLLQEGVF